MLKRKQVGQKLLQGIIEYLLCFPLLVIAGTISMPPQTVWLWLFVILLFGLLGVCVGLLFKQLPRWAYVLAAMVIGGACSLLFTSNPFHIMMLTFVQALILYRGMTYMDPSLGKMLPTYFFWTYGLGIYFISFFVFRYVDWFTYAFTGVTSAGVLFVVFMVLISNGKRLKAVTLSEDREPFVSKVIRRQNRLVLMITLLLVFILTGTGIVQNSVMAGLRWFVSLLSGADEAQIEQTPEAPVESGAPQAPFDDPGEPSMIAVLLEKLAFGLFYILLVVAVLGTVLLLVKKTRKWMKKLYDIVLRFLKQITNTPDVLEETSYRDEKESVFDFAEWKKQRKAQMKGFARQIWKREPNWKKLTNEEKVRYIYRELIEKQCERIDYQTSKTPREMLQELLAADLLDESGIKQLTTLYEKVRYGEGNIDTESIEMVCQKLKR